jgi:hypothetical protein
MIIKNLIKNYDSQLIIAIPTGDTKAKNIIRITAKNLRDKHVLSSDFEEWICVFQRVRRPQLNPLSTEKPFENMTEKSRLYIVGHGAGLTIAEVTGDILAISLVEAGLKTVKRIVLVSCRAGLPRSVSDYDETPESAALQFHRALGKLNVFTEVAARTEYIRTTTQGDKFNALVQAGHKLTVPPREKDNVNAQASKKRGTKIVYGWSGGTSGGTQTTSYPYGQT